MVPSASAPASRRSMFPLPELRLRYSRPNCPACQRRFLATARRPRGERRPERAKLGPRRRRPYGFAAAERCGCSGGGAAMRHMALRGRQHLRGTLGSKLPNSHARDLGCGRRRRRDGAASSLAASRFPGAGSAPFGAAARRRQLDRAQSRLNNQTRARIRKGGPNGCGSRVRPQFRSDPPGAGDRSNCDGAHSQRRSGRFMLRLGPAGARRRLIRRKPRS
jgi:hypothetical protein